MKIEWQDLPKPLNVWTKRNAALKNLQTNEIVQHYSSNTHLRMAQKANYGGKTWYRTRSAASKGHDWAFVASTFGLPNEVAPSEPKVLSKRKTKSKVALTSTKTPNIKTIVCSTATPKDGVGKPTTKQQLTKNKKKNDGRKLLLYLLRWQLSTPVLAFCVSWLRGVDILIATIIANFIGGLLFFWIDRLIFKEDKWRDKK